MSNITIDINSIKNTLASEHNTLNPFLSNTDFFILIQSLHSIIKRPHNTPHSQIISSLMDLRRLLKYEPKLFSEIFDNLNDSINSLLDFYEETPSLLIHVLLLLLEVFAAYPNHQHWYRTHTTTLLHLVTLPPIGNNEHFMMAQLANMILIELGNYCLFDSEYFDVLVSYFDYRKEEIALKAAELAYDIVVKMDSVPRMECLSWDMVIQKAYEILLKEENENDNGRGIEVIRKFIQSVKGLFSEEEWIMILSSANNNKLQMFRLVDDFDMEKVLEKKRQIAREENEDNA